MASRRAGLQANVYDAVAGRVTLDAVRLVEHDDQDAATPRAFAAAAPRPPRLRAPSAGGTSALAPEEALFRPESAPDRYAERDVYMAHDRDSPVLPDSDMLKAVHLYASSFYAALRRRRRGDVVADGAARARVDENSMDETALIAFGILLEEAGRDVLGRRGDLVFTEPQEDDEGPEYEEDDGDHERAEGDDAAPDQEAAAATYAQAPARPRPDTPSARRASGGSPSSRRRKRQRMASVDMD